MTTPSPLSIAKNSVVLVLVSFFATIIHYDIDDDIVVGVGDCCRVGVMDSGCGRDDHHCLLLIFATCQAMPRHRTSVHEIKARQVLHFMQKIKE